MSEVLDPPAITPVTAALDALDSALDALTDAELWTLPDGELVETVVRLHRLGARADAGLHRLVREVDARGAAVAAGAPSTAAWLRHRLRLHPGAAKRLVVTARALHDNPAGPLVHHSPADPAPAAAREGLRAAFAAGEVSAEHVAVAHEALAALPTGLDAATVDDAEAFLTEQARLHDPKTLARLGRHLAHTLDPDSGDTLAHDEEHQRLTRTFELHQRRDGSADVKGHLDPELTAALLAQLMALGAPRPATDGGKDLRTVGQRHADALADLVRLAAGASATSGASSTAGVSGVSGDSDTSDTSGTSGAAVAERVPTRHGTRPTVTITMALETLERRLGAPAAFLDWSGPISAEAARRLACDARVIPVVLGANGQPLDVGRASYPVTQAIWRALVARDGGCAFNGCDRPPEWTEAHHTIHWADGGTTSVENCCLLCDHHHRVIHHHGWDIALINGAIHVIPPPWIDPQRRPRRNTQRAPLAALTTLTLTHPPD